jgi:hypothetical protein
MHFVVAGPIHTQLRAAVVIIVAMSDNGSLSCANTDGPPEYVNAMAIGSVV